jgi:hypothetical protein
VGDEFLAQAGKGDRGGRWIFGVGGGGFGLFGGEFLSGFGDKDSTDSATRVASVAVRFGL